MGKHRDRKRQLNETDWQRDGKVGGNGERSRERGQSETAPIFQRGRDTEAVTRELGAVQDGAGQGFCAVVT